MKDKLALLETCVAHLNDVVIITEAEPFDAPGPRIVFVNDAFVRSTGYTREEAIGQSPRMLQGPRSNRAELDRVRAALESWNSVRVELINYNKDGSEFWCELEIVPVADEKGWYTHWIAIQRDISQRKMLQAQLEDSNAQLALAFESARAMALQAQAASEAKSNFLANMSHEIRTPMNAVLGMLSLLGSTTLNPRQMDYTRNAETAAKSLLRLLNDILDFSKIDANKLVLDPHPFQLDQLAQELSVLLKASALEKNIALNIDLDPRIAPWIVGDAFRLMQVLTNLVGNAIKFTDTGQVTVTMRPVNLEPEAIQIRFEVRDSGIGISAENLQHVFDDFAQAEASTTRRFGGTGLGLTICKRLVDLMGGSLKVSSVLGQGSTFSFELRFTINADARAKGGQRSTVPDVGAAGSAALAGLHILVVEDNALNQRVVLELLALRGASITVADDGARGFEAVAHADPMFDVVLMDVQMPVMDGYAATRAIRENLGLTSLPIIGLTANAFPADREACLSAGMTGHLGKPFEVNALVAQILQCAGRAAGIATTGAPSDGGLAQYPVIEVAQALGRMGNMRRVYSGAAAEFKVDLAGLTHAIQGFASLNDMKALQRLLHTAKGNAGTVGLIRLSQELGRLDSLVTGGAGAHDLLREAQALQSLVQEADTALTAALAELSV